MAQSSFANCCPGIVTEYFPRERFQAMVLANFWTGTEVPADALIGRNGPTNDTKTLALATRGTKGRYS